MNNIKLINNFLRYLTDKGVSPSSLKYYKSDISNFLIWKKDRGTSNSLVKEYLNSIRLTTPNSTINRRLSTLRSYSQFVNSDFMQGIENVSNNKVSNLNETTTTTSGYKFIQEKILNIFKKSERVQNALYKLFFNRPNWYKKYHAYPVASYVHIAILILFSSISGYAVYDQVFYSTDRSLAFPTALERPNRFLSFQGRLTDDLGNPETVATNMAFKLYAVSSGGSPLWDSGTCSITPDQDGIFSTLLGSSCGAEIASSVFSENADIWLGVTVAGDAEATPRIQIATVAYALNSETLQGFPAGTGTSTIPYIDSTGTIVLASSSPKIQSTSGTFAVEGQALTITTPNTSNGIITINPDGTGTLDLVFEGASPGGGANGFVNATNANITSGSLYSGTVASNATGYNFINFLSGSSPVSVFSVQNDGDIITAGDITIGGGNINTGNIALTIGDATTDSITLLTDGTGNGEVVLPNDSIGPDEVLSTGQTDEYCLTYETGDSFEWQTCSAGGSMTNFIAAGDTGGGQTISDSNTLSILGGTNGIDTVDSATDTITLNLDTTEIGTTTFGSGSGITWTFDASGGTDTTIAFGDNIQTFTTGTAAFTGDLTLTAPGDLIFGGTTSLAETTSSTDSGGYLIGTFDEFDYSNSTNVQAVLNDLDIQLAALTTGTGGLWTDSGTVTYLTSTSDDFAIGGSTILASMFGLDESAGNFYFGYDNSANPTFNFEATDADAGEFGFNTNDSFYFSNANVGIGLTNPVVPFQIKTSAAADPSTGATPNGVAYIGPSNGIGLSLGVSSNNSISYIQSRWDSLALFSDLAINPNGGAVGIGTSTTTPNSILEVSGTASTSSDSRYVLSLTDETSMAAGVGGGLVLRGNVGSGVVSNFGSIKGIKENGTSGNTKGNLVFTTNVGADTNTEAMRIDSQGYLGVGTTAPDARIDSLSIVGEQLRLTYTDGSVYSGFTVDSNGYLIIDPTGARAAIDGSLQVGSTSPLAYSRFGTNTTTHAGNITASNDVLISSDLELDGTLFLDGGTIANSAGTAAIVLSSSPTTTANTLSASNWLVENTANVGQAALMVNQTKAGDLFTASASGTTKFTIQNDGDVVLTNGQLRLGNLASAPTAEGAGSMFFNTTTNTNQCYNGTNWFNCGGTLYSNTNAAVADGSYLTVTHDLGTNDLLSSAWINAQGVWKTLESSYQPAIAWEGKDTTKGLYHDSVNSYVINSETGTGTSTLHDGMVFDTFEDTTKTDSSNTTASLSQQMGDDGSSNFMNLDQRVQGGRTGLMGGQTYNTGNTDNDGQTYLASNVVNDVYYYDRSKDSTPEVLVDLGIDPNWYNGVTLSIATTSATYSQNGTLAEKNSNLTTSYNGSLIKASGTDSTPRTIYITIKTPTTFDWTNYQGDSATGVTITPGLAQTLGSTGVSVTFTSGVQYNVGDVFRIASWFIEAESSTRGAKQQFPEKSYLVANDSGVDVIDADTQKLWMKFGASMLQGTSEAVKGLNGEISIANSTNLHIARMHSDEINAYDTVGFYRNDGPGISGRATTTYTLITSGLNIVNAVVNDVDAIVIPNQPTQEVTVSGWASHLGNGTGSMGSGLIMPYSFQDAPTVTVTFNGQSGTTPPKSLDDCSGGLGSSGTTLYAEAHLINNSYFTVTGSSNSGTFFSASTYYCYSWTATGIVAPQMLVAAATDAGATVINETHGWANDYVHTAGDDYNSIALGATASLYALNETRGQLDKVGPITSRDTQSVTFTVWDETTTPALTATAPTISTSPSALKVTDYTSTNSLEGETIYVGTSLGVTVIQNKETNSRNFNNNEEQLGSVKYYTNNHISEEMIGDIRGMWPFQGSGTIANGTNNIDDVSVKASEVTAKNANGTGMTYTSGVRNTAVDLDGTDDYFCSDINDDDTCDADTDLQVTGNVSYGAWVQLGSGIASNDAIFMSTGNAETAVTNIPYSMYITASSGNDIAYLHESGAGVNDQTSFDVNLQTNRWYHVVFTRDISTNMVTLYVDGQPRGTFNYVADPDTATSSIFYMGHFPEGASFFDGIIEDPFVTATTMTGAQVKNMYQVGYRALQGHGTGLGHSDFSVDGNQSFGGSSTNVSAALPDYNNQYMYIATNHISNGALSKIQLNSDTLIHLKTEAQTFPSGGLDLVSEDMTSLAVGESLYAIGSATTGVLNMGVEDGIDSKASATSGNFVSKTYTLPKNIGSAVVWASPVIDASDGSNTITVQASNDGGSNYVTCTLINTNSNTTIPEKEYACTFSTADNDLKIRFQFARGSTKTNTYIAQYGISWLGETGFRVEQADTNNVRLYNFSGETQNLKLNVTGASTAALANPWTDAGSYLYPTGYEALRIYDGSGVNYLGVSHDGTLANLTYNGTTVLSINSAGDMLPNTDDTQSLGSNTKRWKDLFVGGDTLHVGTSTTDEGTLSYDTTNNIFNFGSDSTTNADIAFFTDDLYLDKSTGFVGIGKTNPSASFDVYAAQNSSAVDTTFGIGDGTYGFKMGNTTGVGFAPRITGSSLDSNDGMSLVSSILSGSDTGSTAAFTIDSRLSTNAVLTTRPVLSIRNFTTDIATFLANGNMGLGNSSPGTARLNVSAPSTQTASNVFGVYTDGAQSTANTGTNFGVYSGPSYTAASGNTLTAMYGLYANPHNANTGAITALIGSGAVPQNISSGTVASMFGGYYINQKTGTGAVTTAYGLFVRNDNTNASGAITNSYGVFIDDSSETGTITADWGLYQVDTGATNYFGGSLGVGTTNPGSKLEVENTAGADDVLLLQDSSGTCEAQPTTTGLTWSCSSDQRLKTNITAATSVLDYITNIPLHDYTVIATDELAMGPIAQEMQTLYPELVHLGDDGYLSVSELTPWQIVKGIQELNSKIEGTYLSNSGDFMISGNSPENYEVIELPNGQGVNKVAAFANATIAKIKAGFGSFKQIETDTISPVADSNLIIDLDPNDNNSPSKLAIKGVNNEEVASIDANGNAEFDGSVESSNLVVNNDATVSGTLYADNIKSLKLDEIEELLHEVEENQNLLANSEDWNTNTATESANLIAESVQTEDLFVTNLASFNSLSITDSLFFGTDFILQASDNSINTLAQPLKLQSLAMASLEIMAGKITIDTEGNTKFLGNVEIAGNLKLDGNFVVASDTEISEEEQAEIVEGQISSNATAGKAVLTADTSELTIVNNKIKDNSLIYVTPASSTQNKVLYVKSKEEGQFTVGFSESIDTDVEFNWWIIELSTSEEASESGDVL